MISNQEMTASNMKEMDSVCYGSTVIPSDSDGIYAWKFKIRQNVTYMAIGIDDSTYFLID